MSDDKGLDENEKKNHESQFEVAAGFSSEERDTPVETPLQEAPAPQITPDEIDIVAPAAPVEKVVEAVAPPAELATPVEPVAPAPVEAPVLEDKKPNVKMQTIESSFISPSEKAGEVVAPEMVAVEPPVIAQHVVTPEVAAQVEPPVIKTDEKPAESSFSEVQDPHEADIVMSDIRQDDGFSEGGSAQEPIKEEQPENQDNIEESTKENANAAEEEIPEINVSAKKSRKNLLIFAVLGILIVAIIAYFAMDFLGDNGENKIPNKAISAPVKTVAPPPAASKKTDNAAQQAKLPDNVEAAKSLAPAAPKDNIPRATISTKSTFAKLSKEDYEAAITSKKATFDDTDKSTTIGSLALKRDVFFSGEKPKFWLRVKSADIGNLENNATAIKIDIDYVLSTKNQNLYNRNFKSKRAIPEYTNLRGKDLKGNLKAIKTINLFSGVKEEYITGIKGRVIYNLPVNIEGFEFSSKDIGQQKLLKNDVKVTLGKIMGDSVAFKYAGDVEHLIKIVAYDKDGKILAFKENSSMTFNNTTSYRYKFKGNIDVIVIQVADEFFKKEYPFLIGKEYKK